ncbi:MAG: LytTR family transcriptional regulator [Clostridia bacterium]|nr:LytTR family transcriptional regulator [Clostridia bacterium]
MKCTVIIDTERDEEIIIYTKKKTHVTEEIERIAASESSELFGYLGSECARLDISKINLFTIIAGKLYAIDDDGKEYLMRERLYTVEKMLDSSFVKINQSTLASIRKIACFGTSVGGSLYVNFKNGYRDYVSRRQISAVKRALKVK